MASSDREKNTIEVDEVMASFDKEKNTIEAGEVTASLDKENNTTSPCKDINTIQHDLNDPIDISSPRKHGSKTDHNKAITAKQNNLSDRKTDDNRAIAAKQNNLSDRKIDDNKAMTVKQNNFSDRHTDHNRAIPAKQNNLSQSKNSKNNNENKKISNTKKIVQEVRPSYKKKVTKCPETNVQEQKLGKITSAAISPETSIDGHQKMMAQRCVTKSSRKELKYDTKHLSWTLRTTQEYIQKYKSIAIGNGSYRHPKWKKVPYNMNIPEAWKKLKNASYEEEIIIAPPRPINKLSHIQRSKSIPSHIVTKKSGMKPCMHNERNVMDEQVEVSEAIYSGCQPLWDMYLSEKVIRAYAQHRVLTPLDGYPTNGGEPLDQREICRFVFHCLDTAVNVQEITIGVLYPLIFLLLQDEHKSITLLVNICHHCQTEKKTSCFFFLEEIANTIVLQNDFITGWGIIYERLHFYLNTIILHLEQNPFYYSTHYCENFTCCMWFFGESGRGLMDMYREMCFPDTRPKNVEEMEWYKRSTLSCPGHAVGNTESGDSIPSSIFDVCHTNQYGNKENIENNAGSLSIEIETTEMKRRSSKILRRQLKNQKKRNVTITTKEKNCARVPFNTILQDQVQLAVAFEKIIHKMVDRQLIQVNASRPSLPDDIQAYVNDQYPNSSPKIMQAVSTIYHIEKELMARGTKILDTAKCTDEQKHVWLQELQRTISDCVCNYSSLFSSEECDQIQNIVYQVRREYENGYKKIQNTNMQQSTTLPRLSEDVKILKTDTSNFPLIAPLPTQKTIVPGPISNSKINIVQEDRDQLVKEMKGGQNNVSSLLNLNSTPGIIIVPQVKGNNIIHSALVPIHKIITRQNYISIMEQGLVDNKKIFWIRKEIEIDNSACYLNKEKSVQNNNRFHVCAHIVTLPQNRNANHFKSHPLFIDGHTNHHFIPNFNNAMYHVSENKQVLDVDMREVRTHRYVEKRDCKIHDVYKKVVHKNYGPRPLPDANPFHEETAQMEQTKNLAMELRETSEEWKKCVDANKRRVRFAEPKKRLGSKMKSGVTQISKNGASPGPKKAAPAPKNTASSIPKWNASTPTPRKSAPAPKNTASSIPKCKNAASSIPKWNASTLTPRKSVPAPKKTASSIPKCNTSTLTPRKSAPPKNTASSIPKCNTSPAPKKAAPPKNTASSIPEQNTSMAPPSPSAAPLQKSTGSILKSKNERKQNWPTEYKKVVEMKQAEPDISMREEYLFNKVMNQKNSPDEINKEAMKEIIQKIANGEDAMIVFGGEQDSKKIGSFFGQNILKNKTPIMSEENRKAVWYQVAQRIMKFKNDAKLYNVGDVEISMSAGYYQGHSVINLLDPKNNSLERRNKYILHGYNEDGPYIKTFQKYLRNLKLKNNISNIKRNKIVKKKDPPVCLKRTPRKEPTYTNKIKEFERKKWQRAQISKMQRIQKKYKRLIKYTFTSLCMKERKVCKQNDLFIHVDTEDDILQNFYIVSQQVRNIQNMLGSQLSSVKNKRDTFKKLLGHKNIIKATEKKIYRWENETTDSKLKTRKIIRQKNNFNGNYMIEFSVKIHTPTSPTMMNVNEHSNIFQKEHKQTLTCKKSKISCLCIGEVLQDEFEANRLQRTKEDVVRLQSTLMNPSLRRLKKNTCSEIIDCLVDEALNNKVSDKKNNSPFVNYIQEQLGRCKKINICIFAKEKEQDIIPSQFLTNRQQSKFSVRRIGRSKPTQIQVRSNPNKIVHKYTRGLPIGTKYILEATRLIQSNGKRKVMGYHCTEEEPMQKGMHEINLLMYLFGLGENVHDDIMKHMNITDCRQMINIIKSIQENEYQWVFDLRKKHIFTKKTLNEMIQLLENMQKNVEQPSLLPEKERIHILTQQVQSFQKMCAMMIPQDLLENIMMHFLEQGGRYREKVWNCLTQFYRMHNNSIIQSSQGSNFEFPEFINKEMVSQHFERNIYERYFSSFCSFLNKNIQRFNADTAGTPYVENVHYPIHQFMARNKHIQRFHKARLDCITNRTKYLSLPPRKRHDPIYLSYAQFRASPIFLFDKQEMVQKLLDPFHQKRINAKPLRPSLQDNNQFRLSYCIGRGTILKNQLCERGRTLSRDDSSPLHARAHRAGSVNCLPALKVNHEKKRRSLSSKPAARKSKDGHMTRDNTYGTHPTGIIDKIERVLHRKEGIGLFEKHVLEDYKKKLYSYTQYKNMAEIKLYPILKKMDIYTHSTKHPLQFNNVKKLLMNLYNKFYKNNTIHKLTQSYHHEIQAYNKCKMDANLHDVNKLTQSYHREMHASNTWKMDANVHAVHKSMDIYEGICEKQLVLPVTSSILKVKSSYPDKGEKLIPEVIVQQSLTYTLNTPIFGPLPDYIRTIENTIQNDITPTDHPEDRVQKFNTAGEVLKKWKALYFNKVPEYNFYDPAYEQWISNKDYDPARLHWLWNNMNRAIQALGTSMGYSITKVQNLSHLFHVFISTLYRNQNKVNEWFTTYLLEDTADRKKLLALLTSGYGVPPGHALVLMQKCIIWETVSHEIIPDIDPSTLFYIALEERDIASSEFYTLAHTFQIGDGMHPPKEDAITYLTKLGALSLSQLETIIPYSCIQKLMLCHLPPQGDNLKYKLRTLLCTQMQKTFITGNVYHLPSLSYRRDLHRQIQNIHNIFTNVVIPEQKEYRQLCHLLSIPYPNTVDHLNTSLDAIPRDSTIYQTLRSTSSDALVKIIEKYHSHTKVAGRLRQSRRSIVPVRHILQNIIDVDWMSDKGFCTGIRMLVEILQKHKEEYPRHAIIQENGSIHKRHLKQLFSNLENQKVFNHVLTPIEKLYCALTLHPKYKKYTDTEVYAMRHCCKYLCRQVKYHKEWSVLQDLFQHFENNFLLDSIVSEGFQNSEAHTITLSPTNQNEIYNCDNLITYIATFYKKFTYPNHIVIADLCHIVYAGKENPVFKNCIFEILPSLAHNLYHQLMGYHSCPLYHESCDMIQGLEKEDTHEMQLSMKNEIRAIFQTSWRKPEHVLAMSHLFALFTRQCETFNSFIPSSLTRALRHTILGKYATLLTRSNQSYNINLANELQICKLCKRTKRNAERMSLSSSQ